MSGPSPIACDLSALDETTRKDHEAVARSLLGAVREAREEEAGYALRLPSDPATVEHVARFVARERQCCPFLDFTIHLEREGGPLWLKLAGRSGVKEYLAERLLPGVREAGGALRDPDSSAG